MANRSPPIPLPVGSTSPSIALAAMAASIAFPFFFKISIATCVANGWLVAAMPLLAITSERVENDLLEGRSIARTDKGMKAMAKISSG